MQKDKIDELYHLLRMVSNDAVERENEEQRDAVIWLMKHLLEGGYYLGLIKYSMFYGEKFLLQPTYKAIQEKNWQPKRLVEFGAGLGWFSRGLALKFEEIPKIVTVDKRPWGGINISADLETSDGIAEIKNMMEDDDLIVMSDFLHCITNPQEILSAFSPYPMTILEYMPANVDFLQSYKKQLSRFGGNPIDAAALLNMLTKTGRKVDIKDIEPYVLILIDKEDKKQ